ncbi:MAG: fibronectin type III domain-containing protein [Flavobacterium sp.]|nr:fibronectin type III domain-containing protein [Flavobacterium sp.]
MKQLIYFLLFSTVVFSQNYQYSIEEAQIKPLTGPTGLIASQITETSADLTWTASAANDPVLEYVIYSENNLLAKSVGTGTAFKVTGLTPETTYSVTVRATDNTGKISANSNTQTFKTAKAPLTGVNNQLEEIEYFKAYLLPLAQKATLQSALDTYGSVRLERGDYSGVNIVMKSNQKLYGHPSLNKVSNITIAAGSTNVRLEDLVPADSFITLQPGGVISGCTFKSIKWATLVGTNVMFENNSLINFGGVIRIDCSQSGYFRNNKIIKHQTGTVSNLLVLKGNSATPSYGNVSLHTNFLTPHGNTTDIAGLQSLTFVGLDAEGWNLTGEGTKALISASNMGSVKITDFNGANSYSQVITPSFDIDAKDVYFINKSMNLPSDVLSLRTNMFVINGAGQYVRKAGTVTGFDLLGNLNNSNAIKYNGVEQTSSISNSTVNSSLSSTILGTQHTPWVRPTWETLPDPLGANWKTNRVGKPDQTSYIQGLINTKGIAELPVGTFYIGSTLKLPIDSNHGIIGQGTGKTVIVGLTDDFPLISLTGGQDANFILSYLTLQGGSKGIYASQDFGTQHIAYQNMKFVVFRNQNYGIELKQIRGLDNNFLENLGFVDCTIGFFQNPLTPYANNIDTSSFVDKTMFYKNQFINCGTAVSMLATRADNLDAWVDCKFDRGQKAINLANQNTPLIANCDFSNYTGANVITSSSISMYNSNVFNNSITGSTIRAISTNIEGCNFLDNAPMFSPVLYNTINNHIINSTITGNVVVNVPSNQGFGLESAVYVNSKFLANPTLSKLLVNVKAGVPTVIINTTPNPYPQLLVTY